MDMGRLLYFIILVFAILGWIFNVLKLIGSNLDPVTGLDVLRIIGVVFPVLGAIVGWI